jgi:hypothetical protein
MLLTYGRDDRGRRINITLTTPATVADLVAFHPMRRKPAPVTGTPLL